MTAHDPVLVTADDALAGDVLRLAAAAGVQVDLQRHPDPGLRWWSAAPAVLLGADQTAAVSALSPPRRAEVHVVSSGAAPDALFRRAVDVGAESVVELPTGNDWLVEVLSDTGDGNGDRAVTVAVVGGSGGAGASMVAGALGLVAARSGPTMLVDLDPLGPGLARLVGLDDGRGVTWADLADSRGRLGGRALRDALPGHGDARVLGWSPGTPAGLPEPALVREVLAAGRRGHDWVVVDLPRSGEPWGAGLVGRCDHAVLVVRAALGGVASAARMADRLRAEGADAGVVVRSCRNAPAAEDVAEAVGLPLLGEVAHQRRLDEHLDLGLGPVHHRRSPLATAAARLVESWRAAR